MCSSRTVARSVPPERFAMVNVCSESITLKPMPRFFKGVIVFVVIAVICFLLYKLAFTPPEPVNPTTSASSGAAAFVSSSVDHTPRYLPYTTNAVGKGKSALLFFAGSDVFSEASDAFLKRVYASGGIRVSTHRLEFASATGSRITHGVLVQNTFVLLDPNGNRVTAVVHPSEEELRILLRGNIPVPPKQ